MTPPPLIETRDLTQHFAQHRYDGRHVIKALDGVDLSLYPGETLGLVGETGCGKSTFCRTVMRLTKPTGGALLFQGLDITRAPERLLKDLRRQVQMVFQDPAESLNPRLTVGTIVEEPLIIQTKLRAPARRDKVLALLDDVGLRADAFSRYPHEFSGGQRQRIAIARALAVDPKVLICDEPVSALDVSVQSQVLNLLLELQRARGLALIFVSHDLAVVRHMSDRVAVMYAGKVVELADAKDIYRNPTHDYTRTLIAAIPQADPRRRSLR